MTRQASAAAVAEVLAARVCALRPENVPAPVQDRCRDLLLDVAGLCVAARHGDYVSALKKSMDAGGPCTALGHAETFSKVLEKKGTYQYYCTPHPYMEAIIRVE